MMQYRLSNMTGTEAVAHGKNEAKPHQIRFLEVNGHVMNISSFDFWFNQLAIC